MSILGYLGFKPKTAVVRAPVQDLPTRNEIVKMVGEAVKDAIEGKRESKYWYFFHNEARNTLHAVIEAAVAAKASEAGREAALRYIDREQFIDEIVARIKAKQV